MTKLRECGGKKSFKYRRQAEDFCWFLKRRFLDTGHPYKCRHCGMWHIGHSRGYARFRGGG